VLRDGTCPLAIPASQRVVRRESPHDDRKTDGDHDRQHNPISDQQTQVVTVEVLHFERDLGAFTLLAYHRGEGGKGEPTSMTKMSATKLEILLRAIATTAARAGKRPSAALPSPSSASWST
jgi:hypothetical protein